MHGRFRLNIEAGAHGTVTLSLLLKARLLRVGAMSTIKAVLDTFMAAWKVAARAHAP